METEIVRSLTEKKKRKKISSSSSMLGLVRCSLLNKVKKKISSSSSSSMLGLVRCSFLNKVNKNKKQQQQQQLGKISSSVNKPLPLVTTVTKTTTTASSVTIITPLEDPNYKIHLYLCTKEQRDINFNWFRIDPANPEGELEMVDNPKSNFKPKPKSELNPLFLTPISTMPNTIPKGFCIIPQSFANNFVYAVGGCYPGSTKAFVCNFADSCPVWKELPPMPWPMIVNLGVASPLNGNVYAFGVTKDKATNMLTKFTAVIFDPMSMSWNPLPLPYMLHAQADFLDYALVQTKDRNELIILGESEKQQGAFNLNSGEWESRFYAPLKWHKYSSFVAVGGIIYRFVKRRLYAIDTDSKKPRFRRVNGLEEEMPITRESYGLGRLVNLGKGKLCVVWGGSIYRPLGGEDMVNITCLKFWVGVSNETSRLWAVVDRCDYYSAQGFAIHDVVAL